MNLPGWLYEPRPDRRPRLSGAFIRSGASRPGGRSSCKTRSIPRSTSISGSLSRSPKMFHGYEKMGFDALRVLHRYLNGPIREPDLTIAPDGNPYLHRWYIVPRNTTGNLYLHMQV